MEDRYLCPQCESEDVWFDYAIDAREDPNTGEITEVNTGGERGRFIRCTSCNNEDDEGETWKVTP
jgi:hypothetical protein